MIAFVLAYSDLISAAFGLAAALILGLPAIQAVAARRRFEAVAKLRREHAGDDDTWAALSAIQDHALGQQLGDPRGASMTNLWGYGLLAVSFIFLGMASLQRAHDRAEVSPMTEHATLCTASRSGVKGAVISHR